MLDKAYVSASLV